MSGNTQYLVYKPKLKQHCIFQAIASGLSLLVIVLLIFLPQFTIQDLLTSYDFSVFDEVKLAFEAFSGDDIVVSSFAIFQVLGVIFFVAGFISSIVTLAKNVASAVSPDAYAIDLYDKIKRRADERKRSWRNHFSSTQLVMAGIIYEVFAIVFSVWLANALGSDEIVLSYFAYMTGLNGAVAVTILALIATAVMYILAWRIKRGVRNAIIREDYNIGQENSPAENVAEDPFK